MTDSSILCGSMDASLANKFTTGLAGSCGHVLNISFWTLSDLQLAVRTQSFLDILVYCLLFLSSSGEKNARNGTQDPSHMVTW